MASASTSLRPRIQANRKGGNLDEHTVREGLEGNMCRCTGYHNIVAAVRAGAAAMGSMRQAAE